MFKLEDCEDVDELFSGCVSDVAGLVCRDLTITRGKQRHSCATDRADLRGVRGERDCQAAIRRGDKGYRLVTERLIERQLEADLLLNLGHGEGVDNFFRGSEAIVSRLLCSDLAIALTNQGYDGGAREFADVWRVGGEGDREATIRGRREAY